MNEKEVIKRCQSGDRAAFDELIREFYPYVTGYLMKLTHDEPLTEDLTQETFLKVIRTIDSFKITGKASFSTYIITIAKNAFIDSARRRRQNLDITETEVSSGENIETDVLSAVGYEEIVGYIDGLPPNQQQAIRMKYIDEYTLKEIEAITGVPAKTVKSRIHEGVKKLREIIKDRE